MSDSANEQEIVQIVLEAALHEIGMLDDGDVLTGWVICFEKMTADNETFASRVYGPAGMTTWRALGLVEFLSRTDGFVEGAESSLDLGDDDE